MHKDILFKPIGTIHSDYKDTNSIPIQPVFARGSKGSININPEFVEGLRDLDMFSHIFLIYHLHEINKAKLTVTPFLSDTQHGVFATRAPSRPNPIGFSLVKLDKIIGNIIHVSELDILDGTPLIDIKPFIPRFDYREDAGDGWFVDVDDEEAQRRGRRKD